MLKLFYWLIFLWMPISITNGEACCTTKDGVPAGYTTGNCENDITNCGNTGRKAMGVGTSCDCPDICAPGGACCAGQDGNLGAGVQVGECQQMTEERCGNSGGIYGGNNIPCPTTGTGVCQIGACCAGEDGNVGGLNVGECAIRMEQRCDSQGGIWASGEACPAVGTGVCATGACCAGEDGNVGGLTVGQCAIRMEERCTSQGGIYDVDGSTCPAEGTGACQIGACCAGELGDVGGLVAGGCGIRMEERCESQGGIWNSGLVCPAGQGVGICSTGPCCAAEDNTLIWTDVGQVVGGCQIIMEQRCLSKAGIYGGDGLPCPADATGVCSIGACCAAEDNTLIANDAGFPGCEEKMEDRCLSQGGIYGNDGSECPSEAGTGVCQIGACCHTEDASCEMAMGQRCTANGDAYRGDDATCADDDICITGSCCLEDESCNDVIPEACNQLGGFFNLDAICRLSDDTCCSATDYSCETAENCCTDSFCIDGKCTECIEVDNQEINCNSDNCNCCGDDNVCSGSTDLCMPCLVLTEDVISCNSKDECCSDFACQFEDGVGRCCILPGDENLECSNDENCCMDSFCVDSKCVECIEVGKEINCNSDNCNCCGDDNVCSGSTDLCMPCLGLTEEVVSCNSNDECCSNLGCQFEEDSGDGRCCILPGDENLKCSNDDHCCGDTDCENGICEGVEEPSKSGSDDDDDDSDDESSSSNVVQQNKINAMSPNENKDIKLINDAYEITLDKSLSDQLIVLSVVILFCFMICCYVNWKKKFI